MIDTLDYAYKPSSKNNSGKHFLVLIKSLDFQMYINNF